MGKNRKIINFALPYIDAGEIKAVSSVLRSGWWTTGKVSERFEKEVCRYVGCKYAVAVNSATAALDLALKVIGAGRGDEVIVPTMTFAATAEAVLRCGAMPVLCDCEAYTLNIDIVEIERKITKRTKAIIPVHIGGLPCRMDAIKKIAAKDGLYVIEDAAHAFGAEYKDKKIGTLSDLTAFSFYATKPISTGEGGMLVTDNKKFADHARRLSLHGLSRATWKREACQSRAHYEVIEPGFKYNMPDILAALGVYQLKKADIFLRIRGRYAEMYDKAFQGKEALILPAHPANLKHSRHLYIIKLNTKILKMSRNVFVDKLRTAGVHAGIHYMPLHMHAFYRNNFHLKNRDFPVASDLFTKIVSLPIYPSMKISDVRFVISRVLKILDRAKVVTRLD